MFIQGTNIHVLENKVNSELKNIVTWLHVNKLSLNVDKTHTMIFTNKKELHNRCNNIEIEGIPIETVGQTKFLGVIIDNKLCWKSHINHICNKIAKGIGIIKKVKAMLNRDTLLNLYYTFVYPYLTYCNTIWGKAANIYVSRIFLLQKRIIRIVCNSHFLAHTTPLFKQCKVLTIYNINLYCTGVFMFKYYKGLLPDIFADMFIKQIDIHDHYTRNNQCYALPYYKTQRKKNSLSYYGPYFWNEYILNNNVDINIINTIFTFKKTLREMLYEKEIIV